MKNSKCSAKYRGKFCPANGSAGVTSLRYLPPVFVLVSSNLRLYLAVLFSVFVLCSYIPV